MKKRKILSVFAALAIAASCVFIPQSARSGFDVVAEAAETDVALNGGGITLTKVGKTGADVLTTDTAYLNLLGAGNYVQLNINIPANDGKLIDTFTLAVYYNNKVFSVEHWYWCSGHDEWEDAFSSLGGGTTGNASCDNGILTLTYSSNGNLGERLDLSAGAHLKAILKVVNNPTEKFNFFIITKDTFMTCYDKNGDPVLDSNGNAIIRAYGDINGIADTLIYTGFESVEGDDSFIYNWNPTSYDTDMTTNNFYINGQIKNKTKCTLTGINSEYFDADSNTLYGRHPLEVSVWVPKPGEEQTVSENFWRKGYNVETHTDRFGTVPVDENGDFIITGLEPDTEYYLSVNCWGKFNNNGTLSDYFKIKTPKTKNTDLKDKVVFWMYGDADNNGKVSAHDATMILKYIVGTNKDIAYGNNKYLMANILDTDELNARDATQILRYTVNAEKNIFKKNTPYTA